MKYYGGHLIRYQGVSSFSYSYPSMANNHRNTKWSIIYFIRKVIDIPTIEVVEFAFEHRVHRGGVDTFRIKRLVDQMVS